MIKLGAHVKFAKGKKGEEYLMGSGAFAKRIGAKSMMIYLGPPQNSYRANVEEYNLKEYMDAYSDVVDVEDIVVHEPYIINPASVVNHKFAEELLISDSKRMNYIGAKIMVIHPGAHTKYTREESIETLIQTMKNVIKNSKDTLFCLETMAGKGTEVGTTLEEMAYIMESVDSDRINICLDTCHMWDAGYNLNEWDQVVQKIKTLNLMDKVKVLHINDSKNDLGAGKDRHENIGKGFIGTETLKKIVQYKEFENIPMILETPYVDKKDIYEDEIKLLISV